MTTEFKQENLSKPLSEFWFKQQPANSKRISMPIFDQELCAVEFLAKEMQLSKSAVICACASNLNLLFVESACSFLRSLELPGGYTQGLQTSNSAWNYFLVQEVTTHFSVRLLQFYQTTQVLRLRPEWRGIKHTASFIPRTLLHTSIGALAEVQYESKISMANVGVLSVLRWALQLATQGAFEDMPNAKKIPNNGCDDTLRTWVHGMRFRTVSKERLAEIRSSVEFAHMWHDKPGVALAENVELTPISVSASGGRPKGSRGPNFPKLHKPIAEIIPGSVLDVGTKKAAPKAKTEEPVAATAKPTLSPEELAEKDREEVAEINRMLGGSDDAPKPAETPAQRAARELDRVLLYGTFEERKALLLRWRAPNAASTPVRQAPEPSEEDEQDAPQSPPAPWPAEDATAQVELAALSLPHAGAELTTTAP